MSKRGRPTGINFDISKSIKLTSDQASKWDPKQVKDFLDGNYNSGNIIKNFKRLYEIMNLWLLGRMSQDQISLIPDKVVKEIEMMEDEFNLE